MLIFKGVCFSCPPGPLSSPDKEDMFEEDTTCFAQGSQAMEHMHKLLLQRSKNSWLKAKVWCDDVMQNRGHDLCHVATPVVSIYSKICDKSISKILHS